MQRIHPVFHVSYLKEYTGPRVKPAPSRFVADDAMEEEEFDVQEILDEAYIKDNTGKKQRHYLVRWTAPTPPDELWWILESGMHAQQKIERARQSSGVTPAFPNVAGVPVHSSHRTKPRVSPGP